MTLEDIHDRLVNDILAIRDSLENAIDRNLTVLDEYNNPAVGKYHQLVRYALQESMKERNQELREILSDVERCIPDDYSHMRHGVEEWFTLILL